MIDIKKYKEDIHRIEEEIRTLKEKLRTKWTKPMGEEQWDLIGLRAQATELCIFRAWMRGKIHRKNPPQDVRDLARSYGCEPKWNAEDHAKKIFERVAERYQIEEAKAS